MPSGELSFFAPRATVSRPGTYLVDRISLLKRVPGYGKMLKKYSEVEVSFFRAQLERVRDDTGQSGALFGRMFLENIHEGRLSNDEIAYLARNLFGAGADMAAVCITILMLAAACYPEAQARVQEGIDIIVGKDRGANAFLLQRWLDPTGQLCTDMRFFIYVFGLRVYPGLHVANHCLYIHCSLLMWSFRIIERPVAPIDVNVFI
ncbi:hypothetical protein BDN67DRAFT_989563 [Paxillus ammoniavirescens]|nr:hypothetical protein BDN67DRAFT_989563 [Paxillus ammoniavirescens]